jgi:hypothetical protein
MMQEIRPVPDEGPDEPREGSDPPATDALIDEAEDESFPASDAPAYSQREPKDVEEHGWWFGRRCVADIAKRPWEAARRKA